MVFSLPWPSFGGAALSVSVHPQTTQIMVRGDSTTSNILMGYVLVKAARPTAVSEISVELHGTLTLDWRQGLGPSSVMHRLRHRYLDMCHCLFPEGKESQADNCRSSAESFCTAVGDTVANSPSLSRQPSVSTLGEEGSKDVIGAGEHRFPFEFVVPASLPASVASPLGGVAYSVSAFVRRHAWYQADISSGAVAIDVIRAPPPQSADESASPLQAFPPPTALLFQAPVSNTQWQVSVYTPSRTLFQDTTASIHAFATHKSSSGEMVELVDLQVTLHERISHCFPNSHVKHVTQRVAATGTVGGEKGGHRWLRHQRFDSHAIHALGDAFVGLLPARCCLALDAAQPSSESSLLAVSHELHVTAVVRIPGTRPSRLRFSAPVAVLPASLSSPPQYTCIASDTLLATTHSPPAYTLPL
ncbi:hypothetical protein GGI20_001134 [Coemansia sp. BCRC 34301]|nr:hypothetical protein GGI20_001134 [Coemansia sp. BCRC 34301]